MSATIFLPRLWKIPQLTTSIRPPKFYVNFISVPRPAFFAPKTASGPRRGFKDAGASSEKEGRPNLQGALLPQSTLTAGGQLRPLGWKGTT